MVVIVLSECWEEDNTKNSSICKKVADNRNRGIEPIVRKFHFDYFLSICKVVFFFVLALLQRWREFPYSLAVCFAQDSNKVHMHAWLIVG